jgi:hypothetical protein
MRVGIQKVSLRSIRVFGNQRPFKAGSAWREARRFRETSAPLPLSNLGKLLKNKKIPKKCGKKSEPMENKHGT